MLIGGFNVSEVDTAGNVKYYGFLDPNGVWIIMREDTSTGTFRYATGGSGYAANWAGRSDLTYGLFSEVF